MQIMTNIKEIGKMANELARESTNIQTVMFIRVNGQKILNKVMESYKWQLEINIKEIGSMERKMDLVLILFI
jgi:hypothetical protein